MVRCSMRREHREYDIILSRGVAARESEFNGFQQLANIRP